MNVEPATWTCGGDRPLVTSQHDHWHRRRARGCCCAAAAAVMALALPVVEAPTTLGEARVWGVAATRGPVLDVRVKSPGLTAVEDPSGTAERVATPATGRSLAFTAKSVQTRRVCVRVANVRSGPGLVHPVVSTLRRGAIVRGAVTHGWQRMRAGRWISVSVTCAGMGRTGAVHGGQGSFAAWVRAIDPAGNARWLMDHARTHTRGNVRGVTVFRSSGPARSTVYIQPGMSWSRAQVVMAHEAIHVRQIRYGGYSHSLGVFGSVAGMERAADCGATILLGQVVRGGCRDVMVARVRRLLAGRPA